MKIFKNMKFPPRHIETKDVELLLAELWDFSRAWAGIHSQDSRGRDPHFGSGAERGWVRHLWKDEDLPCLRPPLSTEVKNESVVPSPLKQVPCRRETQAWHLSRGQGSWWQTGGVGVGSGGAVLLSWLDPEPQCFLQSGVGGLL